MTKDEKIDLACGLNHAAGRPNRSALTGDYFNDEHLRLYCLHPRDCDSKITHRRKNFCIYLLTKEMRREYPTLDFS